MNEDILNEPPDEEVDPRLAILDEPPENLLDEPPEDLGGARAVAPEKENWGKWEGKAFPDAPKEEVLNPEAAGLYQGMTLEQGDEIAGAVGATVGMGEGDGWNARRKALRDRIREKTKA